MSGCCTHALFCSSGSQAILFFVIVNFVYLYLIFFFDECFKSRVIIGVHISYLGLLKYLYKII
jgi:hypothetical protein